MVNYITLRQTISRIYTNFLPNADGCHIDLTPVGAANNWECVDDPVATPDEDATYVYSTVTDLQYDLYELPNHTTENDVPNTINYVQIFGRAKSHLDSQATSGTFKLILTDNACTDIYKSSDINIATEYATHSNTWAENPRTDTTWTWDDIDNLQTGLECSSPSVGVAHITTFRPNGAGDVTELTPSPAVPNWQNVDEVTPDAFTTTVKMYEPDGSGYDLYNLTNHTTETGTISKIVVYAWVWLRTLTATKTVIKTGGNTYQDDQTPGSDTNWVLISTEYALNPQTTVAWTWADIDALQAGIFLTEPAPAGDSNTCTQVYVEVFHTELESPEIRTTQLYTKVNYSTHHNMIAPKEVSTDHAQNVREMNMWNGERIVFGESRNRWSLLLKGDDWEIDACEKIQAIQQLGLDGLPITITGLNNINWDTEWMIKSFGWRLVLEKPIHYEWIILLERT